MRYGENIIVDSCGNPIIKVFHSTVGVGKRAYREHHHTECELSLFVEGSGIYSTSGGELEFKKGDIMLFATDEKHCITDIKEPIDLLNIHFEPRLIWGSTDAAELLRFIFYSGRQNHFNSTDIHLKLLIESIEKEITSKCFGYVLETKSLIFSTLIYIFRNYYQDLAQTPLFLQNDVTKKLKEVIFYIDNNLEKDLTLSELSDIACMTETYFSSVFKKFNGISPWNYIMIKRIEKAIHLLRTTNMKKLEIAEHCGFSSSSNFYKTFLKITGKTPSQFCIKKEDI